MTKKQKQFAAAKPKTRRPHAKIKNGVDLVAVVPYLLGFHPEESLVIVLINKNVVALTLRIDLVDALNTEQLDYRLNSLREQFPDGEFLFACYGQNRAELEAALSAAGKIVTKKYLLESLFVHEGRCYSYAGMQRSTDENGVVYTDLDLPVVRDAKAAGLSTLDSRDRLFDSFVTFNRTESAQAHKRYREAIKKLTHIPIPTVEYMLTSYVDRGLADPESLNEDELAFLAAAASFGQGSDHLMFMLERPDAQKHAALWLRVVNNTAYKDQAPALAMLGLASWVAGEGAFQSVCCERASKINSDLPVLRILNDLNSYTVLPVFWDDFIASVRAEQATGSGPFAMVEEAC